jgi:hypothetical protein
MKKFLIGGSLACGLIFAACIVANVAKAETVRHPSTVRAFKHLHPCPSTSKKTGPCPDFVVDHILPLDCNGPDSVLNMQWQSVEDGKLKDRWEIRGDATHKPCSGLAN